MDDIESSESNPYRSPSDFSEFPQTNNSATKLGRPIIKHRSFVGPTFYSGFKPLNYYREKIREEAKEFINTEVGVENIISVTEHAMTLGPFSVVVWYRSEK